jgi:cytidylate kinase
MEKKVIINIGRQFGGGGLGVAHELGKRLGIPVYDKELITEAAQESGFSAEFFEQTDEKKSFFSLSSFFGSGYGETENYISDRGLFKIQSQTIEHIAEQGSAIIVGRCADYILRDVENVFSVFVSSPMEHRVKRIMEREGLTEQRAAEKARKMDKLRRSYYDYYTDKSWGEASSYNLLIDTSVLGEEQTACFIRDFVLRAMEDRK